MATDHACANVLESVPGGAPVIPWQIADMHALTGHFSDERIWLGREGIVTTAGEFSTYRALRAPSPTNVFSAFAEAHKLKVELSPAGQTCQQVISAVGGLQWVRLIASEKVVRLLDRLAHGNLELEIADEAKPGKKRRMRMESASYSYVQEVLMRANDGNAQIAENHLNALLRSNVLKLGMKLTCTECDQRTWYSIEDLASTLKCQRCLRQFDFPAGKPPREAWAYRVLGPFAAENFAHGSYCVAAALQFLSEEVAQSCTWIPSFKLAGTGTTEAEADFGMFLEPSHFSHVKGPRLVLGECKTFGTFDGRDFQRARTLSKLFPGAVLCFATLRADLTATEKKHISAIARAGRKHLKTGQQTNPVLVLTRTELLGQFKIGKFTDDYGDRSQYARMAFLRRDLPELCDFTQQVHLGMESYYEWHDARRHKRASRLAAKKARIPA